MKFRLMMLADGIGHRLHLPRWVICDRFERYLWTGGKAGPGS